MATYVKKNWKNLPDESTPITSDDMNAIDNALYDLTFESAVTIQALEPWVGNITLTRKGNIVYVLAELSSEITKFDETNVMLFRPPNGYRPSQQIFIDGYTRGGSIPIHYYYAEQLFYINSKLTFIESTNSIVISTHYVL